MDNEDLDTLSALQDVLDVIEREWPDLISEDCIPLDIVLPLTGGNSRQSYEEFQNLKEKLKRSLKKAVNAKFMAFNDSIGSYGISIETLNQSQNNLSAIKESIADVSELMSSESGIMHELNEKRKERTHILDILEKVNDIQKKLAELQAFTEVLDFEKAVLLVQNITEIIKDNQLHDIEGLNVLQLKLSSATDVLLDRLLNEIDNNIYSKNVDDSLELNQSNRIPLQKGLLGFIKQLSDQMIDEDEELLVRSGHYYELQASFERVKKIEKQSECFSKLVYSFEREMKRVIVRSVDEIRQKYPSQVEVNIKAKLDISNDPFDSFDMLQGMNGMIIKEVFDLIFKRTLALLQKHIAISHIARVDGYTYRIDSIWREVQKQLSMIIFNYIIDENLLDSMEELDSKHTRQNSGSPFVKVPKQFEKFNNGLTFQFSELSLNSLSSDLLDSLNKIFENESKGMNPNEFFSAVNSNQLFIGLDDVNEGKRHVLVKPNIFNMGYIIDGFIAFINNLTLSFGSNSEAIVEFFEEFMDLIFISQLENTLVYQFDKLCESKLAPNHLLEVSNYVKIFFNKIFILLDTSLYYRPSYVEIIHKLFDRVIQNFKQNEELLLRTKDDKILAVWISDSKLQSISNSIVDILLRNTNEVEKLDTLISTELVHALSVAGNYIPTINPKNFLTLDHMRSLVDLLAALLNIINWLPNQKVRVPEFLEKVELVQKLQEEWSLSTFGDNDFPLNLVNLSSESNHSNTELGNEKSLVFVGGSENELIGYLAVDIRADEKFDNLVAKLKQMMNNVEILIRYEIRIECIWYMIQMMTSKQWEKAGDKSIDLGINKFCERLNDINRIFNKVSKNISKESSDEVKVRVFGGLGYCKLAIFESRRISVMGKTGWMKMIVNLKVLQQVITSIDSDASIDPKGGTMSTSLRYFAIGSEGERLINKLNEINDEHLNIGEEDWKNLVRLIYSEKLSKDNIGNYKKKVMAVQAGLLKGLSIK
ncbi:hypothetical protein CANINC_004103 [Pichia inconspicua]|uniref:Exocyst complex component Sec8 n=1 Tax=Pichia inconspicua TaxID=52247 RepID=A0A4V4NFA2_9ASCO|nr:hypothetical protein CANINC_004103 [[Candida] inconspicua]